MAMADIDHFDAKLAPFGRAFLGERSRRCSFTGLRAAVAVMDQLDISAGATQPTLVAR